VNRFIDHFQVVTTNNYNTIADFHTTNHSTLKSSQSTFTRLYLVTALHSGYSSAKFSLDISWRSFSFRCPFINTPQPNPQLHCTHLLNRTRLVESYSLGVDPQRTPTASPLLLLCDLTMHTYAAGAT
jgi:hypothetical protein